MISYQTTNLSSSNRDGFSEVLGEAKTLFAEHNINILGEGYQEIIADDSLFEDYKTAMLKGVDADEQEALGQLMENSRIETITESLSGITPISSLSIPTVRKLWPRMAMKNAIPTEAVKLPKFSISYLMPYIVKNGERHYLPEALMEGGSAEGFVEGAGLFAGTIELADFDAGSGVVDGATKGFKLLESLPDGVVASVALGDSIDPDFVITGISIETTDQAATPVTTVELVTGYSLGTSLQGDVYLEVSKYAATDYDVDGVLNPAAVASVDTLFGRLDRTKGILRLACANGLIKGATIRGRLSSEYNMHTESISFDVKTRDITIGTGNHLNAPLPIEFLQDTMAMYKIDGAAKVIDIMTNVLGLKLDKEMATFIRDAHVRAPKYSGQFDCKPYAQFSGTPKQWREMLKDTLDHHATTIKQDLMFQGGKFVVVGNQVDVDLIPNVSWSFMGSGNERSGVEVDYSIGAISGAHRYEIIGTSALPKGSLFVFYVSSQDEQMTYKYFPYSFNVEKGYADPQFSYTPSIMMAKRHKLESFTDAIIKIDILNNTGDFSFA